MSITVEALLRQGYRGEVRNADVNPLLLGWIHTNCKTLSRGQTIDGADIAGLLAGLFDRLNVSDVSGPEGEAVCISKARVIRVHSYKYSSSPPRTIQIPVMGDGADSNPSVLVYELPSISFADLWEQLFFEPDIKPMLLRFVSSLLLFSERGVSLDRVSWNRIVLLHGSAGSGKTSLCRALAQKIAVRSFSKFSRVKLVEVNTRTLMSRFLGDGSRLVDGVFDWILEQARTAPDQFFCIMMDEVESIAASRKAAAAANEPADAIRVVNSLLTSLDKLKGCRNILILATSNLLGTIDEAFLDRVDLCQHASLSYDYKMACIFRDLCPDLPSSKLLAIAEKAHGLSGRALKRIPLLMHVSSSDDEFVSLSSALSAMCQVVDQEREAVQSIAEA
ncbi:hypothetical protein TWF696_007691 [Orbilia brochopaga]|uniref:AAA+ ATPase domain-containing protein n=1 Tax=Orbilia brochopaga TaxID=3140254 RepID=A0AAV9ULN5_9PEZI